MFSSATQQLSELEDERKSLSRQLKEKETKLQGTSLYYFIVKLI